MSNNRQRGHWFRVLIAAYTVVPAGTDFRKTGARLYEASFMGVVSILR